MARGGDGISANDSYCTAGCEGSDIEGSHKQREDARKN
jgi:hypothetical protein